MIDVAAQKNSVDDVQHFHKEELFLQFGTKLSNNHSYCQQQIIEVISNKPFAVLSFE